MTLLLGVSDLGTSTDFENTGVVFASKFTAGASGTIDTISIATAAANACTVGVVGIYADSAGTPGARIGNAVAWTATASTKAYFTSATGIAAAVTSGTVYWIAINPTNGTSCTFCIDTAAAASSKDTPTSQTGIPATWPSTSGSFAELMCAHADDAVTAAAAPARAFLPLMAPQGVGPGG